MNTQMARLKTISALTDRVVVLEEAVKKIKENLGIEE